VVFSEFGADSDDDSCDVDNSEERERLKRRRFIMDEFKRRNQVSVHVSQLLYVKYSFVLSIHDTIMSCFLRKCQTLFLSASNISSKTEPVDFFLLDWSHFK